MAKPLVVMYIPRDGYFQPASNGQNTADFLMRIFNGNYGEDGETWYESFTDYWTDYYWLVFPKDNITEPELQVFYEKDFTPIRFEELKKFIDDALADRNKGIAI